MSFLNYIPKVHIHPILFIFIVISFLTGTFLELFIIFALVLFHELGHYIAARMMKWRIRYIVLWVFGGVMDTEEHGNKSMKEEAFVTLAGPYQHLVVYFLCFIIETFQLMPASILELILYYNTIILLFNLIPVWPLDGGKLLLLAVSYFFPYKKAYQFTLIFSMVFITIILVLQLIFLPFTLSAFFIWAFLFMENRSDWKQRSYVFMRFLLRRYEGDATVKGVVPLTVASDSSFLDLFSRFRREKKHPIYIVYAENNRKSVDEADCLQSYFYEREYNQSVGEAFLYK
ncbi:M50 family metallopeptidase [Oceanobacillus polygoni]|uniref:Stage IV sporulation protein FB n=1 Tax=Oceanobacillus polygoni TaxID=1235259 RepID=A0A9X0YRP9_9BACI|nr:M50 family metallopeptidase [Oceanobacillus polygoni]MBP2077449.1 stage IV sporulation protein FB [Oceanobacillus polygoni]